MTLTAALLLSAFHLGLRQSAYVWTNTDEGAVLQSAATASPWATDFLSTYPRPFTRAEKPFITLWLWIPTLPTTPNANGRYQWFGFRVSELVEVPAALWIINPLAAAMSQMVWPGIFIGSNAGVPSLRMRALTDDLLMPVSFSENSWLTLGVSWSDTGALRCYAHAGKVELTEADFLREDDGTILVNGEWQTDPIYIKHMVTVSGLYLDLAYAPEEAVQPEWTIARITTRANVPPALEISREAQNIDLIMRGYPGVPAMLQRSLDLTGWTDVTAMQNNDVFADAMSEAQQFYRLSSP